MKQISQYRTLSIPLAFSSLILLLGYYFKVQHWSYGVEMEIVGFISIALLYGARFFRKKKMTNKDTIKLILVAFWCTLSVIALLKLNYIGAEYILLIVFICGIYWFVLEIIDTYKFGIHHSNLILILGALLLATETVFRLFHWPLSSIIHFLSLLIIGIGFAADGIIWRKIQRLK